MLFRSELGADYCDIASRLEMAHPTRFRELDWEKTFEEMKFDISVTAEIQRTYDAMDPVELEGDN